MKFPFYRQLNQMDCGLACLKMIFKFYGKTIPVEALRAKIGSSREGVSLLGIARAAEVFGLRSVAAKVEVTYLKKLNLPAILYWNAEHFVVLYKCKKRSVWIADPAHGRIRLSYQELIEKWTVGNREARVGVVLQFERMPEFRAMDEEEQSSNIWSFLSYLLPYKGLIYQLVLGLILASLLQLSLPFLTQSIVDVGVKTENLDFIYLILIAQVALFIGKSSVEVIRAWILLHISSRLNISMLADFFYRLMNLPISFFDSRMTGDLMQRIQDHKRIENLLTHGGLNALFSLFNLFIFGIVLLSYDRRIFLIFFGGSLAFVGWVLIFLKKRRQIDYKRFDRMGEDQSKVIEMINGMQEIKLNGAERIKRWSWEKTQASLFHLSLKNLQLEQLQSFGASFINELKNISLTFLSAFLVIKGELSLGMMLAISYIIGQMNSPLNQLIGFSYMFQDAKIALERLNEVQFSKGIKSLDYLNQLPSVIEDIVIEDLSFKYSASENESLRKINLRIPAKKITAIVGGSGSGKSTLLKVLLNFYEPNHGKIRIGRLDLKYIDPIKWRGKCGVVLQEGYIFNDSILGNIVLDPDQIDIEQLERAISMANLEEVIDELPLGWHTQIGNEGINLSSGQKQRVLIARAIYKNPEIIFLDEATSALDAINEKEIIEGLDAFLKDRTCIIIAHRLSTIKNADQIVMLENGRVKEKGKHLELIQKEGAYFNLVKNQLEFAKAG